MKNLTTENFIEKAKRIHGDKYNYNKVNYVDWKTKVCIICPKHGEFWQRPNGHLTGKGCMRCAKEKLSAAFKLTEEEFIEKARNVHGDKYDYNKVVYVNNHTKVCIICPKHGEFWQTPMKHLAGQGCSKCKNSSLELAVENKLKRCNIRYETHKFFKWLKLNGPQHLDFFLPDYNIAIECQGEQHYNDKTEKYSENFEKTRLRDENKYMLLEKHNIRVLYYTKKIFYCDNIHRNETFFTLEDLFKHIKKEQ